MIPAAPRRLLLLLSLAAPLLNTGCTWISYLGTDTRGAENGITYYIGGAGPFGQAGTLDVPKGLRQDGYRGAIECFGWQSIIGGTLRDQMDRSRNEEQARRLARRIEAYAAQHPGRPINIIALSAGTSIATWALEELDESVRIKSVIFLASSLSRRYDLSRALQRIDMQLLNFYSSSDPILSVGVPLTGTADRERDTPAGLRGFVPPTGASEHTRVLYTTRVLNIGYRKAFSRYGNHGGHIDATNHRFIRRYIAPVIRQPLPPAPLPKPEEAPSETGAQTGAINAPTIPRQPKNSR